MGAIMHAAHGLLPKNKLGKVFNVGVLGVGGGVLEFAMRRSENPQENVLKSAGIAAFNGAAWYFAPGVMWGVTAAQVGAGIGQGIASAQRQHMGQQMERGQANFGGQFRDNDIAATARQRGIQAIGQSRMNARGVFGNEAKSLHRF